jgi:hypothetical protein
MESGERGKSEQPAQRVSDGVSTLDLKLDVVVFHAGTGTHLETIWDTSRDDIESLHAAVPGHWSSLHPER